MTALKVVAASVLAVYAVQIGLFNAGMIELGAAVAGYLAVLVGVVVWARHRRITRRQLGLRWPRGTFVLAGVLVGVSAWYVNLFLVALVEPPGDTSGLEKVVEQTPLAVTIVALALLPAVSEEIVFRGVLTRALATRFAAVHAIGFSAAVFALYHLLPAQMISTFVLGLALGLLTLRARSAIPAMIAHLLNNAIAVVVSRDEVPGFSSWLNAHPLEMLAMSTLVLASGLLLAASRGGAA